MRLNRIFATKTLFQQSLSSCLYKLYKLYSWKPLFCRRIRLQLRFWGFFQSNLTGVPFGGANLNPDSTIENLIFWLCHLSSIRTNEFLNYSVFSASKTDKKICIHTKEWKRTSKVAFALPGFPWTVLFAVLCAFFNGTRDTTSDCIICCDVNVFGIWAPFLWISVSVFDRFNVNGRQKCEKITKTNKQTKRKVYVFKQKRIDRNLNDTLTGDDRWDSAYYFTNL